MSKYEFKANSAAQIAAAKDLANLNWPASRKVFLFVANLLCGFAVAVPVIPGSWYLGYQLGVLLDLPIISTLVSVLGGVGSLMLYSWIWSKICPWLSTRLSKNRIFDSQDVSLTADASGVCWQTEHSEMLVRWSGIQLITVAPSGVLFVLGVTALYVPREQFGDQREMQALVDDCEAYRSAAQS